MGDEIPCEDLREPRWVLRIDAQLLNDNNQALAPQAQAAENPQAPGFQAPANANQQAQAQAAPIVMIQGIPGAAAQPYVMVPAMPGPLPEVSMRGNPPNLQPKAPESDIECLQGIFTEAINSTSSVLTWR